MNTPAEQAQLILGKLLKKKGGMEYIVKECKTYEPDDRNDRARLKRALMKALKLYEEQQ